jgi:hypothetical protein
MMKFGGMEIQLDILNKEMVIFTVWTRVRAPVILRIGGWLGTMASVPCLSLLGIKSPISSVTKAIAPSHYIYVLTSLPLFTTFK